MKVKVDKDKCISCGLCTSICSRIFVLDTEGKSEVQNQPKTEDDKKCAKESIASCPVKAINE